MINIGIEYVAIDIDNIDVSIDTQIQIYDIDIDLEIEIESPKGSTKELLEFTDKFKTDEGYKNNAHNSVKY